MHKTSEPKLTRLLQEAVDRGQAVLIAAPTGSATPLHDRTEAELAAVLCLLFKLGCSEGLMLAKLAVRDHNTKEQLQTTSSAGAMRVLIHALRKKLAPHAIEIVTINTLGYGLTTASRSKIRRLLNEYDGASLSTSATGIVPRKDLRRGRRAATVAAEP